MPDYSYNKDYPFAAFITNLGKYNEGELVGEWVKFPTTAEEMKEVFKRIGIGQKDDFGNPYEEWFITDYDCYVDGLYPRVYTNKPRTTGGGYKGLVHQPDPEKKPDMLQGIIAVRELHQRAILESGLTCADEMLYPENHRYVSDLLSYVAIGARSVEDQQHRLTASGVGIPVGMKNPTGGDLSVMMNSITAAQGQHVFLYRGWEVQSLGNPYAHALLRGYVDKHGKTYSNYHYEDLNELFELYQESSLKNPGVIIDTNHANSGKHYLEQIRIAKEVMHSCHLSKDIRGLVKGLMIESYIEDGNQPVGGGCYGKSITDPCLGWEKSERLIYEIADLL